MAFKLLVYLKSLEWTLVWLAPEDTQDSAIVSFSVSVFEYWSNGHDGPIDPYKNVD